MMRDLEAEGVLPAPAKSYGSAEFSTLSAIIKMQAELKTLRDEQARHTEVMAGLAAKVRALEGLQQPVEVKGSWQTGGVDQ